MSAWAKPGVKCVCIDSSPCRFTGKPSGLAHNAIYMIRIVLPADSTGTFGLLLFGIRAPTEGRGWGYSIRRFRPLITRSLKQDTAMFRAIFDKIEEPA